MARIHPILLLATFFICSNIYCQQENDFSIREFNTENGMPSNGVKGLQWDEQTGFLWIATEAGLVRFNGLNLKTYTNKNTPIIRSERLLFLIKNNKGNIFTADIYGNIIEIKENNPLTAVKLTQEDKAKRILFSIIVSKQFFQEKLKGPTNNILVLNYDGILPVSDTSCYFQHFNSLFYYSSSTAIPEKVDFKQPISIKRVIKFDGVNFIVTNSNEIFSLEQLLTDVQPVNKLINKTGTDLNDKASRIYWQNGMLNPILINNNKAWKLSLQGNEINAELICTSVPLNSFIDFVQYSDKLQTLFIGTNSKGFFVIKHKQLNVLNPAVHDKNLKNAYYAQVELSNGNILTNNGNVLGANPNNQLPAAGHFDFNTYLDQDSILWYSQVSSLYKSSCLHSYDYRTGKTTVYPKIVGNPAYVKYSNKLFLTTLYGIGWLDNDSMKYLYKSKMDISAYDMLQMKLDVLALSTCNALILVNTTTAKLDTIFRTTDNCIRTLWKYKDYLFFGTYGKGYYVYKDGIIRAMPLDVNNYLAYTHCFMQDDDGYVWMSSNRGLFKAKLTDMIDAYEKKLPQIYYHYLGKDDGMNTSEMNGGCTPCAIRLRNKTISFPTMDGLVQVNPKTILPVLPSGDIFIDEVVVDGKPSIDSSSKGFLFPYSTAEIAINLSFTGWCNKENIYLEYQLDNDNNWKKVSIDNGASIKFSNLSYGNHVLNIRKLNGFGINNFSYKQVSFSIATPWYKKWWFILLLIIALLAILSLIFKWRLKQFRIKQLRLEKQIAEKTKELKEKNEILEKNDSIKTRLISIISHDIVTPLKFLSVAGKNLQEKRKQMPEELQQETIEEITNTSTELQLLSTNILNWIKYQNEHRRLVKENFNVAEMVKQVFGVLNSLAKKKNIQLVNNVDSETTIYQFFEPLKISVYNMVSNAINFSEEGKITVSCTSSAETITISIADNGVGMTTEQINNIMGNEFIISSTNIDKRKGNGLGYLIIKDLLKMMNASLQISSEKNKGTVVSFVVPAK
jgi:signal transduction histidine kinase